MNCKQVLKQLDDYRAGLLDTVLTEIVENHLQTCPQCRKAMDSEMSVSNFLKNADVPDSKESVADMLLKKLEDLDREKILEPEPEQAKLFDSKLKALMIIALLAGIGLTGFLVIRFDSRPDYHSVGRSQGPGFTWMGTSPFQESMETRWQDPVLVERDRILPAETKDSDRMPSPTGRVIHVLNFDENGPQPIPLSEDNR